MDAEDKYIDMAIRLGSGEVVTIGRGELQDTSVLKCIDRIVRHGKVISIWYENDQRDSYYQLMATTKDSFIIPPLGSTLANS